VALQGQINQIARDLTDENYASSATSPKIRLR